MLTTWEGKLGTGKIREARKSLPMPAADRMQLFECMTLIGVPPISPDTGSHFGALQARPCLHRIGADVAVRTGHHHELTVCM
jgi:hypothetical protein